MTIYFTDEDIRKLKELTEKDNPEFYSLGLLLDIRRSEAQQGNKNDSDNNQFPDILNDGIDCQLVKDYMLLFHMFLLY